MEVNPQRMAVKSRLEPILLAVLLPIILFFNFWNLESYPVISGWDEGIYLQFAQNLALHGKYGSSDGEAFHVLIPAGGSGPTIITLIAGVFNAFGVNLLGARLVMAGFLFLATVSLYLLIREVSRWEAALAGVLLFLVAGYGAYDSYWVGRQVLFEVPALAFLFLGYWFLFKTMERFTPGSFAASLILFGLAVVTKNQLLWVLAPGLGIMVLLDLFHYRQKRWPLFAAALTSVLIFYAAWFVASLEMTGSERAIFLEAQSSMLKATYLHINLTRIWEMVKIFIKSGFFLPIAIAWLYVLFSSLKRDRQSLVRASFLSLAAVGLFSALVVSLPWPRYLYMGIVLAVPVVALFLADIAKYVQRGTSPAKRVAAIVIYMGLAALILVNFYQDARLILGTKDNSAREFAQAVDSIVPAQEHILNWEWEVEFYSQRTFIHPDFRLFPAMIDATYNNIQASILNEPVIPDGIQYVIVGPFANDTGTFTWALEHRSVSVLHTVGEYTLYLIR